MSPHKMLLSMACALALGALGCGDANETPSAAPSASAPVKSAKPAASNPAPAPSASAATADANDVPTEADFEDEAENDITSENVGAELEKIEKELQAK